MTAGNSHIKYAMALYRAAGEHEAAGVLKDLEHLAKLFKDENFRELMRKIAYLEKDVLKKAFQNVFKDKVQNITFNLLVILAGAKKLMLLPKIEDAFARIYHEAKGIHEVTIKSARPLSKDLEEKIVKHLEGKHKKSVNAKFEENPELIGGFQIYERGFLTDYSLQNYLAVLKKSLMSVGE